jgi:hypothetical protein
MAPHICRLGSKAVRLPSARLGRRAERVVPRIGACAKIAFVRTALATSSRIGYKGDAATR